MIRGPLAKTTRTLAWLAAVLCFVTSGLNLHAETVVDILPATQVIDLSAHGAIVSAARPKIAIELPASPFMKRSLLSLDAAGSGPNYTWVVYNIRNVSGVRREMVVAIDPQRLSASQLFPVRPFGRKAQKIVSTLDAEHFVSRSSGTQDAFAFELAPGSALAIAVEGDAPMAGIRIYDGAAFSKRETSVAFLRGAALTVTLVITLFIVGLYSVRSHRAFVAGSVVAFACLQFMALESGLLDRFNAGILNIPFNLQHLRAWSETLLAFAFGLGAWGLSTPNARPAPSLLWVAGLGAAAAALAALAWYNDVLAAALARLGCGAAAGAGFLLALRALHNGGGVMSMGMTFWSMLTAWVLFASMAMFSPYQTPVLHAGLLAGLATAVAILSFALARLALAQGYLSNAYLTKSASRSLALAGGRHALWDWRPNDNRLLVSDDLARSLGHDPALLQGPDSARLFLALVHPADQLSYQRAISVHGMAPGDSVDTEVRLQAANGKYQWFALRAAAVPGASNLAERAVGTLTDITDKKETEGRLITEALRDPVTGLPSRAIFNDRLERELANPIGLPVKVLLIGLSRFKLLNEGLGNELGDQILLAAGQRISECLLPDESLARISGGMFAVMYVEAIGKRDAEMLASEILGRLTRPIALAGQDVHISAAIGISQAGIAGASATTLHDEASRALSAAQATGTPVFLTFDGTMKNEKAEVAVELDLRRALVRGEIEVHYQPILAFATRTVVGFEALARWRHPERGYLPPSEFIAVAEQSGLVGEISTTVLAEAARQLGVWQRTLARNRKLFVAINISAEQLTDPAFFDRIATTIEREALLPASMAIEITESVAMRFPERARRLISKLKSSGVSVSCDDFGTGFSNLAALRDLRFDTLKLDRSFIAESGHEGRGGIILSSVITLAHQLGMKVVAEGVETEDQTVILEALGVDLGQGFWLGGPMPAAEIPALLAVLPVVEAPQLPSANPNAPRPGRALRVARIPGPPRPTAAPEAATATPPETVDDAIRQIVLAAEAALGQANLSDLLEQPRTDGETLRPAKSPKQAHPKPARKRRKATKKTSKS